MQVCPTKVRIRAAVADMRRDGQSIGLVPTMGFLHDGHMTLVRAARAQCDRVVVSIFVNPTQFGPNEDFATYPRDPDRDLGMLQAEGVDAVFTPDPAEMYHPEAQTIVETTGLSGILMGALRPGHFRGVATVVTKLFNIVQPDVAVFGEKDFQQLAVIRRMVSDLNIPVRIVGHPIVREADGLAMSSRNANLDPANRAAALSLSTGLQLAREKARAGVLATAELTRLVSAHIHGHAGTEIDYVSFVDSETLEDVAAVDERTVLALAVRIDGRVRLIDNGFVLPRPTI